jgi:shikimate dehydrogenase
MIDAATRLYAVWGDPVAHSLSPLMHNCAFQHMDHNGVYLAFRVRDVAGAVKAVRALGIHGVSVTIPHKVAIMKYLDAVDPLAVQIGAVNTLTYTSGILKGGNTDGLGAVAALSAETDLASKRVCILGAGGAARAIGFALLSRKARVIIVNRTVARGEILARHLETDFCALNNFSGRDCDILINTTPVGMNPGRTQMPVPADILRPEMVVMDIVYNPIRTRLLQMAEKRGCTIVDGVGMFVNQGALQFETWTGRKAPLELMNRTVRWALSGNS